MKETKLQGNFISRLEKQIILMASASNETAKFVCYTPSTTLSRDGLDPTFDIEVGDVKVTFITTNALIMVVQSARRFEYFQINERPSSNAHEYRRAK
jgi:hypothetical protein